jgi:hypothetical protein
MLEISSSDITTITKLADAPSYDGHSLRAQAYFGEAMLDIERAPEGAKCYKAMLGTKEIYFHEHEIIMYMGKKVTGAELYQLLSV